MIFPADFMKVVKNERSTFRPNSNIKRSEVAVILTRMMNESARLEESVNPLNPEVVRMAIRPVMKYTHSIDIKCNEIKSVCSTEDIWIPSYREVFGSDDYEAKGPTYTALFSSDDDRLRRRSVKLIAEKWWLRSADK